MTDKAWRMAGAAARLVLCAAAWPAAAQTKPASQDAPQTQTGLPASVGEWASTTTYAVQADGGIVVNPQTPDDGINFGRLFTDKANRPILDQLLVTLARDTDAKATGYDIGFKLQILYGSDARIVHTLGVFDHLIHDRNQLAVTEADVSLHTPWLFGGGIDLKGGIFPSPLGFEIVDAKANPFYSHSYIFGVLPYEHFGVLSAAHVSPVVDLYLGLDTGVQTTIGDGDNNRRPAGIAGIGLTLLGGELTVLGLVHLGPENPKRTAPSFADKALRSFSDVVLTYKATDRLSFTTELTYDREDGYRAEAYGVAQYASYALSGVLALNARAELFRDGGNFFVSTPVNNLDYVNAERGYTPANFYTAARPTTYSEFTAGLTFKPAGLPKAVQTALVRSEIRYDRALNNARPFDDGKDKGAVTVATDLVIGF